MEQETPRRIPADDLDREQYLDHSFDLVARIRAAREAAEREMNKFGHVSEYEVRKIYGQQTNLTYDEDEVSVEPQRQPSAATERTNEGSPDESRRRDIAEPGSSQSNFDFEVNETRQPSPGEEG